MDRDETFNLSYWRVTDTVIEGTPFLDAFFAALQADDEIAAKLATGDPNALQRMLPLSLVHLAAYRASGGPDAILAGIAERQNRHGRDIRPHMYDAFLTTLVSVVASYDPEYDADVGEAWRAVLSPGMEYLKAEW